MRIDKVHYMLNTAINLFGIDPQSITPLPGGHFNQVFSCKRIGERDGRAYVLRLTPPNEENDLHATHTILAFLKFLAGGGIQVPEPVESLAGLLVEAIPDPANPGGPPYLAAVFVRAAGFLAEEMPVMVWEDSLIEAIGRAVGLFHACSRQYRPQPALDRPHWEQGGSCFNPPGELAAAANPDSPHHWVLEKRAAVLAEIERLPREPGSYGLIHADLHFGNVYFERIDAPGAAPEECGDAPVPTENDGATRAAGVQGTMTGSTWSVTLLDFDDCAYGWFAMDIAMNLLDAAVLRAPEDWDEFAAAFLTPYLRGYRSAHPFEPEWLARLPLFLKLLEIGLYLMVADDYALQDRESWIGKFMAGRRERIAAGRPVMNISLSSPA